MSGTFPASWWRIFQEVPLSFSDSLADWLRWLWGNFLWDCLPRPSVGQQLEASTRYHGTPCLGWGSDWRSGDQQDQDQELPSPQVGVQPQHGHQHIRARPEQGPEPCSEAGTIQREVWTKSGQSNFNILIFTNSSAVFPTNFHTLCLSRRNSCVINSQRKVRNSKCNFENINLML